jgi:hypothetical protein
VCWLFGQSVIAYFYLQRGTQMSDQPCLLLCFKRQRAQGATAISHSHNMYMCCCVCSPSSSSSSSCGPDLLRQQNSYKPKGYSSAVCSQPEGRLPAQLSVSSGLLPDRRKHPAHSPIGGDITLQDEGFSQWNAILLQHHHG